MTTFSRSCGEGDLEPGARERFADHTHHQPTDPDAGDATERAREQGVERSLEGEHAHQVPPAHPYGARYTKLVLALSGEHHEDQEDQEHARGDRELPEEQEDAREGLPALVSLVYGIFLDRLGFEVVFFEKRCQFVDGSVRACCALDGRTFVGDEDGVDAVLLPHPLLQPLQSHDHRGRGGRISPTFIYARHRQLRRLRNGHGARARAAAFGGAFGAAVASGFRAKVASISSPSPTARPCAASALR